MNIVEDRVRNDEAPLCRHCRYPLLSLRGFMGISSRDNTDLIPDRYGGLFILAAPGALWRAAVRAKRRRWVKCMHRELLPEYPFSLICPACFLIVRRGLTDNPDAPPQYVRPGKRNGV